MLDDFVTWDEDKYEFVREVLWQDQDGHFIGLDHSVPLGANGISLSSYSGLSAVPQVNTAVSAGSQGGTAARGADINAAENGVQTAASPSESSPLKTAGIAAGAVLAVAGGFGAYMLGKKSVHRD